MADITNKDDDTVKTPEVAEEVPSLFEKVKNVIPAPVRMFGQAVLDDGRPNEAGDDSIVPTSSPLDFIPYAELGQLGAQGVAGAVKAAAPAFEKVIADETGAIGYDLAKAGLPRSGPPGAMTGRGNGLVQEAQYAMTGKVAPTPGYTDSLAMSKQLYEDAQAALAQGKVTPAQAAATQQRYMRELDKAARATGGRPKRFAEGGEVAFPSEADTQAAFEAASTPSPGLPPDAAASPEVAERSPAAASGPVNVIDPGGALVSIPGEQLADALAAGYQQASPEHVDAYFKEEKYGTGGQQLITGLEGAASAATFGLSTGAEKLLGVNPEDIQARRETNPIAHGAGQAAGLIGSAFIPGVGAANALEFAGAAGAKALGMAAAESTIGKIGSAAVKAAIENMGFQAGDEASKAFSQDPNQSAQSVVTDIGLSGVLGGVLGGGLNATGQGAKALWDSALGSKTGGLLKSIANRAGGIEGQAPSAMESALQKAGIELAPEVRAGLSNDPQIQGMFKTLEQSDTTTSGQAFQETYRKFRGEASDAMVLALGKDPAKIADVELSKAASGNRLGKVLADEFDAQVTPLSKEYEGFHSKFKNLELDATPEAKLEEFRKVSNKVTSELEKESRRAAKLQASGDVEGAVASAAKVDDLQNQLINLKARVEGPGTTDLIADKVAQLAQEQGWTVTPSSEIMREVGRVVTEIKNVKTLNDLGNYIKAVGNNMQADPLNGPLVRAGGMIKGILKDAEADIIGRRIGSEEGAHVLERFQEVRKAYAQQSALKEALDDRLHIGGSTSGFAKQLRTMAQTDSETLLRRLSGTNDAHLLEFLGKNYPKTAEALRNYHLSNVVQRAVDKAKPGQTFNATALVKAIDDMEPEMRAFAIPAEAQGKIRAVQAVLDHFDKVPHNFSNTARTLDKLNEYLPATAMGMATLLTGHGVGAAALIGTLTKHLSKDAPDAIRLTMLKFLGSNKPVSAGGFKAAVDYLHAAIKAEGTINRATSAVFKAGTKVLSEAALPSERGRDKLDKQLKALRSDQTALLEVGKEEGHYLPEQAQAMGQTAASAVNYLNGLRPNDDKRAPLDSKPVPSTTAKAAYNRALDIAQQPLSVLKSMQAGMLTAQDVTHLRALYPDLYAKLAQQLTDKMIETTAKGDSVPYKTRLGLSLFIGQPLDSTMTANSIVAAQPKPPQGQPETATAPATGPRHSSTALNKLPAQYMTAAQTRQARAEKPS